MGLIAYNAGLSLCFLDSETFLDDIGQATTVKLPEVAILPTGIVSFIYNYSKATPKFSSVTLDSWSKSIYSSRISQ